MKKIIILSILIFVVLSLLVVFLREIPQDIYYNRQDKTNWENLLNYIESNEVVEISMDMYELDASDKENILDYLKSAKFYKSNWRHQGPTGNIIYITFEDDRILYFSDWGGGILEAANNDGQFLIINSYLEILINEFTKSIE